MRNRNAMVSATTVKRMLGNRRATGVHAVLPPSTVTVVPVTRLASSDKRYETAPAASFGSARPSGALRRIDSSLSPSRPAVMSVAMKPGATQLTVMLVRPSSLASDRVNPLSPALDAP